MDRRVVDLLFWAINKGKKKTSAYDTTAIVKRVEGNTAYVHIPGGVDETPVRLTVSAQAGDKVQVRVGGGRAWITGNATAPPTDDKTARQAQEEAGTARKTAVQASEIAEGAKGVAETAREVAQTAAETAGASVASDTLHYLATPLSSGVTINTPGWTTAIQTIDETNKYLWIYHTYTKANGGTTNTQPVIIGTYGEDGEQGPQGPQGPKGDTGATGPQGPQGSAGTGISSYSITYGISDSASVQPTSWDSTAPASIANGKWFWTKTVTNYTDSTQSTAYSKAYVGTNGQNGQDGTSVTILGSYNTLAELEAAHPTGNVGDGYMVAGDLYVWNGTAWQDVGQIQGPQGPAGQDGTSISISSIEYGISDTASAQPSSWSTTAPTTIAEGKWLWVRTNYSDGGTATTKSYIGTDGADGTSVYVQSATKTGNITTVVIADSDGHTTTLTIADGEDGDNGAPGANGLNGYVHVAWANSADGSVDFSTSVSTGKSYLGSYTDNTSADSQDYHNYSWSLIKGPQGETGSMGPAGPTGQTGPQGPQGPQGNTGIGISAVQPQYYLSTSATTTTGGQWTTTMTYTSGKYIWTRERITRTNSTVIYSDEKYNSALTAACRNALTAKQIAEDTNQYFWHVETGTDTGAHITEVPKDDFIADPDNGGGNFLARSNGIAIRDGLEELATFGAGGTQVGKSDDSNVQIAPDSIKMFKNQLECVSFSLPTEEETRMASNSQLVFGDRAFSAGELVVTLNNISGFDNTRHFIDCLGLGRYELTLTTQGGYDQADPSTYYYVQQLANGNWAFYSNANRTTQVIEELTTEFYKNVYTAPAYVGCYAKKSNIYRPIMFAVGNGEPDDPSNALEVDWFGNLTCGSIDSGKYEGSNISAGSYDDFTISFNHEFSAAPIVTVSFKANTPSSVASMGNVSMTVYDVSTTGFKVRVYNNSSAGRLPHINWIAILS